MKWKRRLELRRSRQIDRLRIPRITHLRFPEQMGVYGANANGAGAKVAAPGSMSKLP